MDSNQSRYLAFEDFVLDTRRRSLTKNGVELPISSRQFDLLLTLVRNEGRTLTHEELLDTVWAGTFVEQSNLKKGISALRSILGETPSSSLFIKTVPRKGYAFVPRVRAYDDDVQSLSVVATEVVVEEEEFEDEQRRLPERRSGTARRFVIAALALGALLIGAAALVRVWRTTPRASNGFMADRVRISRVTDDGNCWDASISADGNFILCGRHLKDGQALVAKQIAASSEITLLPPENGISFYSYRISPDGSSVFYILNDERDANRSGLYQIPFLGGSARKITPAAAGHISIAPDGKTVAFVRIRGTESQIVAVGVDGSDERVLGSYGAGHRVWGLNFSPDGKSLLCSVRRQSDDRMSGFVDEIPVDGSASARIFESPETPVFSAAWLADRSGIILGLRDQVTQDQQIWQYVVGSGELLKVTNDANSYRFPALNKAGSIILATQERMPATLTVADARSDSKMTLAGDEAKYSHVSWIPDGRVMFTSYESGGNAVWIMNADGTGRRRLTDGKDQTELNPRLSRDGRSVIFNSARGGTHALWKIGIDGLGLTQLTPNSTEMVWQGALLSDGSTCIWESQGGGGNFLWIRRDGAAPVKITPREIHSWDVSPDEKSIVAGILDPYGTERVEVISIETGETVRRFDIVPYFVLRWANGGSFLFDSQAGGRIEVRQQSIDGGPSKTVFERDGEINEVLHSFDVEPETGRLAYSISKLLVDAVAIRRSDAK